MKIWHLPPRYLDTTTLRSEFHVALDLYERIAEDSPSSDDRLFFKFYENHKFVLLRLLMVHQELSVRGIHYPMDETELFNKLKESKDYCITESNIQRDMNIINDIWEDSGLANEIPALLELMSLSDTEQMLAELNFTISQLEEEFDL